MFKLPFFSKKNNTHSNEFLTVDIGSQTVKCLAFRYEPNEATGTNELKLIGLGKEWLKPGSVRNGDILDVENIAKALDSAIYKATENIENDINNVIFGVSGNVCLCLATTAKINRGDKSEEPILEKEYKKLSDKILDAAITDAQTEIGKKTGDIDMKLELITTSHIYTKIDGQKTDKIIGNIGKNLELAMFSAFIPKYYIKKLEQIGKMLDLNIMAITSNAYAVVESLKRSGDLGKTFDGILLDIGSDTTDITVVFGGGIVATKSINIGGNHFTREISTHTGLNFAEAEKKKYDATFNNLNENERAEIEGHLASAAELLTIGLELAFLDFEGIKTFASDIYMIGGGSKLPVITETLNESPWTKSIPFKEPPNVTSVDKKSFGFIKNLTDEAKKSEYIVPLSLSIIFEEMHSL